MPIVMKNEVKYDHHFDRKTNRHFLNGVLSVLHCHHYACLYTQLAIDAAETDLLKECSRDTFREVLGNYFQQNSGVDTLQAKLEIACQYYGMLGLGAMKVLFLGDESAEVEVPSSHIDNGWMKKWGQNNKPVNYITAGYIEALCEAVLDAPARSFEAVETQSIVMGANTSKFKAVRR